MKGGILVLSLFLFSLLIISGCTGLQEDITDCIANYHKSCFKFDLNDDGFVNILDLVAYTTGRSSDSIVQDTRGRGANISIQSISSTSGAGTLEIYASSTEDIYGFQFSLENQDQTIGVNINGASGGIAAANGYMFTIGCGGECVVAYNFDGDEISTSDLPGVLVVVSYNDYYDGEVCFKEGEGEYGPYNIVSGQYGVEIGAGWIDNCGEGGIIGCTDSDACNYNAVATIPCTDSVFAREEKKPRTLFSKIKLFFMSLIGVQKSDVSIEDIIGSTRENECCEYPDNYPDNVYDCGGSCIAELDVCGVCGGDGPTILCPNDFELTEENSECDSGGGYPGYYNCFTGRSCTGASTTLSPNNQWYNPTAPYGCNIYDCGFCFPSWCPGARTCWNGECFASYLNDNEIYVLEILGYTAEEVLSNVCDPCPEELVTCWDGMCKPSYEECQCFWWEPGCWNSFSPIKFVEIGDSIIGQAHNEYPNLAEVK